MNSRWSRRPRAARRTLKTGGKLDLGRLELIITNPAGGYFSSLTLEADQLGSGTTRRGIWQGNLRFPAFIPTGEYAIEYHVWESHPQRFTSPIPLPHPGIKSITVMNSAGMDSTGPELLSISLDRTVVDISDAEQTIGVSATVVDSAAGLKSIFCTVRDSNQKLVTFTTLYPDGGAPYQTGTLNVARAITIPRYRKPGLCSFEVRTVDGLGNRVT